MRGKDTVYVGTSWYIRITPAYAGKRFRRKSKFYSFWDHPRLCGEKQPDEKPANQPTGSPPPMRGKDAVCIFCMFSCGITPAYAGKSCRRLRLCQRHQGSPPPMRGKAQRQACHCCQQGITPAYAGKSLLCHACLFAEQDHPRLCGEKCTN